jgi:FkbM family methyltransferase
MAAIRRFKNFIIYCVGGYRTLENWRAYIGDLLRWQLGIGIYTVTKFFVPSLANILKSRFRLTSSIDRYTLRNGTIFDTYKDGGVQMHIVFFEIYCREDYDSLDNFKIDKNDVVIDVGAHLGFFAIKAAMYATNGVVYAIEPCTQLYELLKRNVAQNQVDNVEVEKIALAGTTGDTMLHYSMGVHPYDISLLSVGRDDAKVEERISTVSLDDFFERHEIETCNFLKMDCEGSEYDILMNAGDAILDSIERIACEWHRFDAGHQPEKLAEFLKSKGFQLVEPDSYEKELGLLYAYRGS